MNTLIKRLTVPLLLAGIIIIFISVLPAAASVQSMLSAVAAANPSYIPQNANIAANCDGLVTVVWDNVSNLKPTDQYSVRRASARANGTAGTFKEVARLPMATSSPVVFKETVVASGKYFYDVRTVRNTINKNGKVIRATVSKPSKRLTISVTTPCTQHVQKNIPATPINSGDIRVTAKSSLCRTAEIYVARPIKATSTLEIYRYRTSPTSDWNIGFFNQATTQRLLVGSYNIEFQSVGSAGDTAIYSPSTTRGFAMSTEGACGTTSTSSTPTATSTQSSTSSTPVKTTGWIDMTNDLYLAGVSQKITTSDGTDITRNIFGTDNAAKDKLFVVYKNDERNFVTIQMLTASMFLSTQEGGLGTIITYNPKVKSYVRIPVSVATPINMSVADSQKVVQGTVNKNFSFCLATIGCSTYEGSQPVSFLQSIGQTLSALVPKAFAQQVLKPTTPKDLLSTSFVEMGSMYPFTDQNDTTWNVKYEGRGNGLWACGLIFKNKYSTEWGGLNNLTIDGSCTPGNALTNFFSTYLTTDLKGYFGTFTATPQWGANGFEGFFAGYVGTIGGNGW